MIDTDDAHPTHPSLINGSDIRGYALVFLSRFHPPWKFRGGRNPRGRSFGVETSRDAPRAEDGDLRSYKSRAQKRRCSDRDCSPIKCIRNGLRWWIYVSVADDGNWLLKFHDNRGKFYSLFVLVRFSRLRNGSSILHSRPWERDWMDGFMRTSLQMDRRIHRIIWNAYFRHGAEIKLPVLLKSDFSPTFPFNLDLHNYRHVKLIKKMKHWKKWTLRFNKSNLVILMKNSERTGKLK